MSGWPRTCLCLCRSDEAAGGCLHSRCETRQRSGLSRASHVAAVDAEFPILGLCKRALQWRLRARKAQFLIIHDRSGSCEVCKAEERLENVWVQAVDVCSLDRVGHADLLLALSMGFDRVVIQKVTSPNAAATQAQEIELAQAMGANERLVLYSSATDLCKALAKAPKTPGRWRTPPPAISSSRQGTARACACALLPDDNKPTPLPSDAPYGAVQLNASACSMCENCVWLCPTDALSVSDHTSELLFVESNCIQCGMCKSICPEDALRLEPRMMPPPISEGRRSLHQTAPAYCASCGEPFTSSPVMDRLLSRLLGDDTISSEEGRNQKVQKCSTCRVREIRRLREKQLVDVGLSHLEPRRCR